MAKNNSLVNSFSRVFTIEGGARPDRVPVFEACMSAGALEYGLGDITTIECPDPNRYGHFIEIGVIRGAAERPTISLTGRYAANVVSRLLRFAKKQCSVDVHIHLGTCTNPKSFNEFTKAIVIEDASPTNYSTDDLGALSSDDAAAVNETLDLSGSEIIELVPMAYSERASNILGTSVVDVIVADTPSCGGDCEGESDGCQKIYAVTLAPGGSPSTSPDVVYSLDGGQSWASHEISTLGAAEDPSAIARVGEYIVVTSNATDSLHVAAASEFNLSATTPTWSEVGSSLPANDIWSVGNSAFIVGDGGYVWYLYDPTAEPTELEAGVATSENLNAVYALSETSAVAVGQAGAVIYTTDGELWSAASVLPTSDNLLSVWMLGDTTWLATDDAGHLWYTVNQGQSWVEKLFPGSGAGSANALAFSGRNNGFMSHTTAGGVGRILRTYNGGQSWIVAPEGSLTLPATDNVLALAACEYEHNFVVGVGENSGGTSGYIVVGKYSE